jgi:hypothetical protein
MKFVKIGTHVEGFTESPPENLRELLEAHSLWLEKQKAEGRLLEASLLPGARHGLNITVWDFASPEDIDKHFWRTPCHSALTGRYIQRLRSLNISSTAWRHWRRRALLTDVIGPRSRSRRDLEPRNMFSFPDATAEKLFTERLTRTLDAAELRQPDRIPISIPANYLLAEYGGISHQRLQDDAEKQQEILEKFALEFAPDIIMGLFSRPGISRLRGARMPKWPGRGLPESGTFSSPSRSS